MSIPTKAQIESWPAPNYVNPQTRVDLLLGVEAPLTGLAILFVGARFYSRTYVKYVLGWDDWFMAAATLLAVAVTVCHCISTQFAAGYHLWDIKMPWIPPTGRLTYATLVLFAPTASLAKISICMTYLRVFPSASDRRFAQFGIAFSVLYCVTVTLLNVFQCWPIASYWAPFKYNTFRCIDRRALTIATQAVNSASDFLIFLWPARTLSGVRLPRMQRFGLIFVFSIGVVVCIAGVCRIWYLTIYFDTYDIFYEGAIIFILAGIETNLGIICGSLPGCKPLLAQLFPRFFGSSSEYSDISRSRYALPGARVSIRLSRGEPAYLPPSSNLSRQVSVESVPIKLDMRYPEYAPLETIKVLSPVMEVHSPTVSERAQVRGATSWYNDNEPEPR